MNPILPYLYLYDIPSYYIFHYTLLFLKKSLFHPWFLNIYKFLPFFKNSFCINFFLNGTISVQKQEPVKVLTKMQTMVCAMSLLVLFRELSELEMWTFVHFIFHPNLLEITTKENLQKTSDNTVKHIISHTSIISGNVPFFIFRKIRQSSVL